MAHVLLPLPARDFDPSEAAVSWRVLVDAGHAVSFATPDGLPAVADDIMLTGRGLDLWGPFRCYETGLSSDFCCGPIAMRATPTPQ
jgi:hypothetical protein